MIGNNGGGSVESGSGGTRNCETAGECAQPIGVMSSHAPDLVVGQEEWLAEMKSRADRRDDLGFIQCLMEQILKSFREDTAFHRLMLYAGLEGQSLPVLFHERSGSHMRQVIRNYVVLRQREGAFPKGNADSLVLLLVAPAMQYAISKYIFRGKCVSRPDKDIAEEFAKLMVTALHLPVQSPRASKSSKKTSKRKPS